MRQREFIAGPGVTAATWPLGARGQQADRVRIIGALTGTSADDPDAQMRLRAFVQGLQELGWIEGRNIRIDARWGSGSAAAVRKHAIELVALAPDVILASGSVGVPPVLQARAVPSSRVRGRSSTDSMRGCLNSDTSRVRTTRWITSTCKVGSNVTAKRCGN
jgi:putative ABC transport system substrate-binding protein